MLLGGGGGARPASGGHDGPTAKARVAAVKEKQVPASASSAGRSATTAALHETPAQWQADRAGRLTVHANRS